MQRRLPADSRRPGHLAGRAVLDAFRHAFLIALLLLTVGGVLNLVHTLLLLPAMLAQPPERPA